MSKAPGMMRPRSCGCSASHSRGGAPRWFAGAHTHSRQSRADRTPNLSSFRRNGLRPV